MTKTYRAEKPVASESHEATGVPQGGTTQTATGSTGNKVFDVSFSPSEFTATISERYTPPELPFSEEFKPYKDQWQFRWFEPETAIKMNGTGESLYFQIVRRGDTYKGVPFSEMFLQSAFDEAGFIGRGSIRDANTGTWKAESLLCARPLAAWEAHQKAIARASEAKMKGGAGTPLHDQAASIGKISDGTDPLFEVRSQSIKIQDPANPWR
ncbi:MAG: hypothetical protein N2111_13890 [Candidatus Sumerlaeaceae bacterium]|nr:hypothetical protein [Candidatus Sumerlaeaceae bacterium]